MREVPFADFVEHRPCSVRRAVVIEAADQCRCLLGRADRMTERNPAAPMDAVHDKGRLGVIEQELLVAEQPSWAFAPG
jgi:hypothetical protein